MTQELQLGASLRCNSGSFSINQILTIVADQANQGIASGIHTVTTSSANISFGDVGTARYCLLQNLGTHNVDAGQDNSGTIQPLITLIPGDVALFPLKASTSMRMLASGGSSNIAYWILAA